MARPKKTEASVAIEKRLREMEKDKPKVYNIMDDGKFGQKITGQRFTQCAACGVEFEQNIAWDYHRYSTWKTCPSCRSKLAQRSFQAQKAKESGSTYAIPYEPLEWQKEAYEEFKKHRFQVLACGVRCLTEDAFVSGCNKKINEVVVGDEVVDRYGNTAKVISVSKERYQGKLYELKAVGCLPIRMNDMHPILVAEYGIDMDKGVRELVGMKYVEAHDFDKLSISCQNHGYFKKHYLCLPRIKGDVDCTKWDFDISIPTRGKVFTEIPLNYDTAWLFGLYCAEGCILGENQSKLTLNVNRTDLIDKVKSTYDTLGYDYNARYSPDEGTCNIIVGKQRYARKLADEIGRGSLNKHIPRTILFNKDENILKSFLRGYYDGDGWKNTKRIALNATTVSEALANDLRIAWARLGYFATINKRNRTKKGKVCNSEFSVIVTGAEVYHELGYVIESSKQKRHRRFFVSDDYIFTPIESYSVSEFDGYVYGIETETDTFVANGVISHNTGKDKYSISVGFMYFIECLNENRHLHNFDMVPPVYWWIIAPTFKLAEQNWRQLKVIVKKTFRSEKEFMVACDNGSMTMQTVGGGVIEVRSAFNSDMLVGVGLDLVTITEAAKIKDLETVWANLEGRLSSPGRGLEIDRKGKSYGMGKAIINSSPLGENYFYTMFKWGVKGSDTYSSDWCSLQFPWTANPSNAEAAREIVHTKYGDITREQDMIARLGLRRYEQDFLGKFLPSDGVAFKDFMDNCVTDIYVGEYAKWSKAQRDLFIKEWQEVKPYGNYRISYDPATGSSSDSPTLVVRDMGTNNIVRVLDMYGKSYEQQWDTIAVYSKLYNHAPCVFSDTGHTPVIGQLEKRGVPEIVLHEQGSLKGKYIQSLVLAVQNKDLHILFDGSEAIKTLCAQMNDYKEKNGKYGNDEEPHDDFVSALYLNYYDYGEQINEYAYAFDFIFM